jgi:hypothetical protein
MSVVKMQRVADEFQRALTASQSTLKKDLETPLLRTMRADTLGNKRRFIINYKAAATYLGEFASMYLKDLEHKQNLFRRLLSIQTKEEGTKLLVHWMYEPHVNEAVLHHILGLIQTEIS